LNQRLLVGGDRINHFKEACNFLLPPEQSALIRTVEEKSKSLETEWQNLPIKTMSGLLHKVEKEIAHFKKEILPILGAGRGTIYHGRCVELTMFRQNLLWFRSNYYSKK